jgi:hypothetical protein
MNRSKKIADKTATTGNVRTENQATIKRFFYISKLASTPAKPDRLPFSRATILRRRQEGKFSNSFKLGVLVTVCDLAQVDAFVAQYARGTA